MRYVIRREDAILDDEAISIPICTQPYHRTRHVVENAEANKKARCLAVEKTETLPEQRIIVKPAIFDRSLATPRPVNPRGSGTTNDRRIAKTPWIREVGRRKEHNPSTARRSRQTAVGVVQTGEAEALVPFHEYCARATRLK
jgi:hypothetical protein